MRSSLQIVELFSYGRTTSLNVNEYIDFFIFNDGQIERIKQNDYYKDILLSIQIASPSLYDSLINKNSSKVNRAFDKYFIRSSIRPTPFGLFSGVYKYDDKDMNNKIFIEVDEVWIQGVVEKLKQNAEILIYLSVHVNPSIIKEEISYRLFGSSFSTKDKKFKTNKLFNTVISEANTWINYQDLFRKIRNITSSNIQSKQIFDFINYLIEERVLLTNIDFQRNGKSTLENVISVLNGIPSPNIYLDKLRNILLFLKKLNQESALNNSNISFVQKNMEKLFKSEHYFKAIKKIPSANVSNVDKKVKENAVELTDLLFKLEKYLPDNHTKDITKNLILEKYGKQVLVPITLLLGEKQIQDSISDDSNNSFNNAFFEDVFLKFNSVLDLSRALKRDIDLQENNFFKDLTDFEENKIQNQQNSTHLYQSLELCVSYISKDNRQIGKVYLSNNIGSDFSGKMIGRFVGSAFNKDTSYDNLFKDMEMLASSKKCLLVDLDTDIDNYDVRNILPKYNCYTNKLCLGMCLNDDEDNIIRLEDLYVYVDENYETRIYSTKHKKNILFCVNHMMNSNLGGLLYRFINSLSSPKNGIQILGKLKELYVKSGIENSISYGNIILFSPSYRISVDNIKSIYKSTNINFSDFSVFLSKFKSKIHVKYVYLVKSDNRLLLNLNINSHIEIAYEYIRKDGYIQLSKVENELVTSLKEAEFQNNKHVYQVQEHVMSFLNKNTSYFESNLGDITLWEKGWLVPPFNSILYLKLYGNVENFNYILLKIINPFLKNLDKKLKFYFIRYADPNNHIRLRIYDFSYSKAQLSLMKELLNSMYANNFISDVQIGTYTREVHRYGTDDMTNVYEDFFWRDSLYVFSLLNKVHINRDISMDSLTVLTILEMIKSFKLNLNQSNIFWEKINSKKYQNSYRSKKIEILKVLSNNENNFNDLDSVEWKRAIDQYVKQIEVNCSDRKVDILCSCIHMFINRFYGINKAKELEVMGLTKLTKKTLDHIN